MRESRTYGSVRAKPNGGATRPFPDLDRLERMILRRVTREYFLLDGEADDD